MKRPSHTEAAFFVLFDLHNNCFGFCKSPAGSSFYLCDIKCKTMENLFYITILAILIPLPHAEKIPAASTNPNQKHLNLVTMEQQQKYVGMWVTADGYIRQELLPGGRYDEARGSKKSA